VVKTDHAGDHDKWLILAKPRESSRTYGHEHRLRKGNRDVRDRPPPLHRPADGFARSAKLIRNEGVPSGTRGLQFYPNRDGSEAVCLWESESIADVQTYVDEMLGDSSVNACWEVDGEQAFADRPLGMQTTADVRG
jgi:hypothetical protein